MKALLLTIAMVLASAFGASAQVFKIGFRGGVNIANNDFAQISTGDHRISPLKSDVGYQVALVTRISIPHFLQISPEFQMVSHTYRYRIDSQLGSSKAQVSVKRFEIPVTVGFNIWALRLFGGPVFSIAQTKDIESIKRDFNVYYDDSKVTLMVGAGLDLGKFFIDARYNFNPKQTRDQFVIDGTTRSAKIKDNGMWQFSAGFFF